MIVDLLPQRRALREQRGHHVCDADALEHAHDAPVEQPVARCAGGSVGSAIAGDVAPREVGEAVDEEAEEEDQRAAPDDLRADRALVVAAGAARGEREVGGDADDEQEERKDQVRRRPPVPLRVLERRVDAAPSCPGSLTRSIPATVRPRKTSSESSRSRGVGAPERGGRGAGPGFAGWMASVAVMRATSA